MSSFIEKLIADPSQVFVENAVSSKDALGLVKTFLDPIARTSSVLDEIYTEGLDSSQIWGQVKLVVDGVNDKLLIEKIPVLKEKIAMNIEQQHSAEEEEEQSEEDDDQYSDDDKLSAEEPNEQISTVEEEEEEEEEEHFHSPNDFSHNEEELDEEHEKEGAEVAELASLMKPKLKKDAFGLNDGFFDIDAFNKEVLAQEENNGNEDDDEDEIDYFADVDSEDEVPYYEDFFQEEKKPQKNKKVRFLGRNKDKDLFEEDDGSSKEEQYEDPIRSTMLDLFADDDLDAKDKEEGSQNLSSFEKRQLEIQKEIAKLEQEAVAEKKWALKGESKAKDRPSDALLGEDLEFERTAKPVPVITKEVTESIEELIRRRIKDQQFDELERKLISDVARFNKSKRFELSEQKSSKSLAEEYEDESNGIVPTSKTSEELEKAHQEISQLFQTLSHKLDSLCSAHFIPKPAQKALDIKVDTATIAMEDAQPLTFSNSTTLAPQELYSMKTGVSQNEVSLKSGLVISKDELSRDEKQRLRRLNKRKKSKDFKNQAPVKKSKKNEIVDTLSKAKNLTVINSKGEKRDVQGNLVKDKRVVGSSNLKL